MRFELRAPVIAVLLALGLAFAAGMAADAMARGLEPGEKSSLAAAVAEFNSAMSARNFEGIANAVPPRLLKSIADTAQVPPDDVRKSMIDAMKMTFATVILDSFSIDLAAAEYKELSDGRPYVLIPTQTVVVVPEQGKVSQKTRSLAIIDDGKWYLLRIDEPQQLFILRKAYPEFAGVEFPQGSMEILKK
jgi:hypothetical protein